MSSRLTTPVRLLLFCLWAQVARAEQVCFEDDFGRVRCENRLSLGARIGIGIGIAVLVLLLFACAGYSRRRRLQRRNLAYITNPNYGQNQQQSHQPQFGGSPYQHQAAQPGYQPGYPPNQSDNVPPGYTSYAPPTGAPPVK